MSLEGYLHEPHKTNQKAGVNKMIPKNTLVITKEMIQEFQEEQDQIQKELAQYFSFSWELKNTLLKSINLIKAKL